MYWEEFFLKLKNVFEDKRKIRLNSKVPGEKEKKIKELLTFEISVV